MQYVLKVFHTFEWCPSHVDRSPHGVAHVCFGRLGKYGTIEDVKIPRPIKNEKGRMDTKASESVEGLGKVFIRFERIEDCTSALTAIAGRQFAGQFYCNLSSPPI